MAIGKVKKNGFHDVVTCMISIVIVNYNGMRFLHECLLSLVRQSLQDFEIIFVDNASSDGSVVFVEEHYPQVRIIRNENNLGFAAGTNLGIAAANGEFIFTLNNDTRSDPFVLQHLASGMNSDPRIGICATKMLFPDERINSTGMCVSRSGAAWDRGMFEPDIGQYDKKEEVFGACAGAALYRKAMLDEIGLFDEDFFMYMEDFDLSFRARLAGWKCMYIPSAVVYHHHGGTARYASRIAVYYVNRNVIWTILKNYPLSLLIICLPWIIGRHCALIGYYSIMGQFSMVLRSKLDALSGFLLCYHKRKTVKKIVSVNDLNKWFNLWAQIPLPMKSLFPDAYLSG